MYHLTNTTEVHFHLSSAVPVRGFLPVKQNLVSMRTCRTQKVHNNNFLLLLFISSLFLVCNHVTRRPCWGSKQKNISSNNLHENRVQFPEERNAFVLDHQHGRRDVTCKPAILTAGQEHQFTLNTLVLLILFRRSQNPSRLQGGPDRIRGREITLTFHTLRTQRSSRSHDFTLRDADHGYRLFRKPCTHFACKEEPRLTATSVIPSPRYDGHRFFSQAKWPYISF